MFKKIVLLVAISFLFANGFASVTKVDYDRAVDFMNCRLIGEYINLHYQDQQFGDLSDQLKFVRIDQPIPGKTLKSLLTKKNVPSDVIDIFNEVDARKDYYGDSFSNAELIDDITNNYSLQANAELQDVTAILKKDISLAFTRIDKIGREDIVNVPDTQTLDQVELSQEGPGVSNFHWLIYIIILLLSVVLTSIINNIIVKLKIARIYDELNPRLFALNRKLESLKIEFGELMQENSRFSQSNLSAKGSKEFENLSESVKLTTSKSLQTKTRQVKMLYARDTKTNIFDRVYENFEPQYTFFEIEVSDDSTTAYFKVSTEPQTMIRAIKNKSWVLDSVCETVKGSSFDAKSIINEMPGKLKKTSNGSWEIIQKAKITFK